MTSRVNRSTARPRLSSKPWTAPQPGPASTNSSSNSTDSSQENQALRARLGHSVEITREKQHEFAAVAQAEGVSLGVARRLLQVVAGSKPVPSVATLGRATLEAGRHAGALVEVLDEAARPRVEQAAADEIFSDPNRS